MKCELQNRVKRRAELSNIGDSVRSREAAFGAVRGEAQLVFGAV